MKIIKDIRLYKSEKENEFGNPITYSFADKELNAIVHRIVMKLRENNFSLGDFDHLYINFTICETGKIIELSEKVDKEHPWYRYCSVKISEELYSVLGAPETYAEIIKLISNVLVTCFKTENFDETYIKSCVQEAVEQGENMVMLFKEKVTTKRKAQIFLRYLDTCKYYPLLLVYDNDDNLLFKKDLPETLTLDFLGNIQLSANKITIKPRKNMMTVNMKDLTFGY